MNIKDFFRTLTPEGNGTHQQAEPKPGPSPEMPPSDEKLTNRSILMKITELFRRELLENSFDEVVTFPMTFTVGMAQEDFDRFKGYMPLIAQLSVKNFYKIIKEEMGQERSCANMATYWDISFIPCIPDVTQVGDEVVNVPKGKIFVFATVNDTIENISNSDGLSNVSLTVSGSEIYGNVNINRAVLANLNVVDTTHFRVDWDRNMSPDFKQPKAESYANEKKGIATPRESADGILARLTCNFNGNQTEFLMERNTCTISGSGDERTDVTIYKLPCKMVKPGHVNIQYIAKSDKFMVSVFGRTVINGTEIKQSSGGDVNWVELPAQANLNLNGVVMVKFKKNETLN